MNLTSMLVLTTMFINVSNNLPKTSYMKMMDVWLLFNLLYPFIIVLLHTYMDTLRIDDDREFNHHGKTMQIGEDGKATEKTGSTINVSFFVALSRNTIIIIYLRSGRQKMSLCRSTKKRKGRLRSCSTAKCRLR